MDTKYKVEGEREVRGVPGSGWRHLGILNLRQAALNCYLPLQGRQTTRPGMYNVPFFCNRVVTAIILMAVF